MLNDWSHKVRAILKRYCPGNIKKILPCSQSAWNTRFYFGHQNLCMDNNVQYCIRYAFIHHPFLCHVQLTVALLTWCLRLEWCLVTAVLRTPTPWTVRTVRSVLMAWSHAAPATITPASVSVSLYILSHQAFSISYCINHKLSLSKWIFKDFIIVKNLYFMLIQQFSNLVDNYLI